MTFKAYMHVERLTSVDCEGLLENSNIVVTAKVDSTNSCVWYENGSVHAGSRTREVFPGPKDNANFAEWVYNGEDDEIKGIRALLEDYPHFRVFGEWMAKFVGHIKDYNQEAKYHMYIFDVWDDNQNCYLPDDEWRPILKNYGLEDWFVAILAVVDHPTYDDLLEIAKNNKFLLDSANHAGEGIVCKAHHWRNKYGRQQFGKLVLDEFVQGKKKPKNVALPGEVEREIVEFYITNAEISKAVAKICLINEVDVFDNKNPKLVGMLLSYMWKDFLEENIVDICKKFKTPIIDFAKLKGMCNTKVKKYIGL